MRTRSTYHSEKPFSRVSSLSAMGPNYAGRWAFATLARYQLPDEPRPEEEPPPKELRLPLEKDECELDEEEVERVSREVCRW